MLTRHGILRERFADILTDALRASLLRLRGYRVDVMEFVESQHTPRNTLLRAVRTGARRRGRERAGGVRRRWSPPGRCGRGSQTFWASRGAWEAPPRSWCWRVPFVIGLADRGVRRTASEVFRFQDPAIVESSGLVVDGDLVVTTNDSGDTGRVFTVDRSGETVGGPVGRRTRSTSRRWRRPAGARCGSGDIGDNAGRPRLGRGHPGAGGRGDRTVDATPTGCVYPDGAARRRDAAGPPGTGRLYVVTKEVFGGTLRGPGRARRGRCTNRLRPVGR